MRLQICRNTANWLRLGIVDLFIPAEWQGKPTFPSLFPYKSCARGPERLIVQQKMKTGDYASQIDGVQFLRKRELEPVATQWYYRVANDFSPDAARSLFSALPDGCEICCFEADKKMEEAYLFFQRVGHSLMLRRGGHGWMSAQKEESLDRVISLFLASPLVAKPHPDFESFTITKSR